MEIVVATANNHKLQELRKILPESFIFFGMKEKGWNDEIPETGDTFHANALIKARYLYGKYGVNCLADDSGLEVEALQGRPGVWSARYAGPEATDAANVAKLLEEMEGESKREAAFKTVLALILHGKEYFFEGKVSGHIALAASGNGGFGYDPVFVPEGYDRTFSEMTAEEKNRISHRARAAQLLGDFLRK